MPILLRPLPSGPQPPSRPRLHADDVGGPRLVSGGDLGAYGPYPGLYRMLGGLIKWANCAYGAWYTGYMRDSKWIY